MENPPDRTQLRTWFAFGLRLLGIWELLSGAGYFLIALNISMGLKKTTEGSTSFGSAMTYTFGYLILALWLLKGAPSIARFFYPDSPERDDGAKGKSVDSDTPTI
jgi:hypothetical protein